MADVADEDDFDDYVESFDGTAIDYFFGTWCAPCRMVARAGRASDGRAAEEASPHRLRREEELG